MTLMTWNDSNGSEVLIVFWALAQLFRADNIYNSTVLKENFTLITFSLFHLNWPRIGFYKPIYKNQFFFSENTNF